MHRAAIVLTLLGASVLFAGAVQAQRRGGTIRSGPAQCRTGFGHRDVRSGFSPMYSHDARNNRGAYPLWYDEAFWDDEPYGELDESAIMPAPQGTTLQSGRSRSAAREVPAANPKVIELPDTSNSASSKPQPAAMFILTNGERLEVRRYLLTHDTLYLTVDRHERTVPLAMLDINATAVVNHERGVEMRIPAGRSEISLSF